MTERERSKDRPPGSSSSSTSHSHQPSAHGYFMGLFGGSKRSAAPAQTSTTKAHATNQAQHQGRAVEEILSPKSGSASLALPALGIHEVSRRTPSPLPFDLHAAIETMQAETEQTGHLVEIVNSTASYLAGLISTPDDIFSNVARELPGAVSIEDIRTLYVRAAAYADVISDTALRTAAIRLLAALIATYPPVYFATNTDMALPDSINVVSLYKLITAPSRSMSPSAHVEAVYVEVGALKGLTKNGSQVSGLDGIVGWLLRALEGVTEEFAVWCIKKDEWETKPIVCDVVIAIVDLLRPMILAHIALFSSEDIAKVIKPVIDVAVAGIAACTSLVPDEEIFHQAPRKTYPVASVISSPPVGALGFEPVLRQSIASGRSSRKDTGSSFGTPTPARPRQFAAADARWTRPLPVICSFLDELIEEGSLTDKLFEDILVFLCLCFGQDETEQVPEAAWNALYDVLHLMLSPKGGRRGELVLHIVLEGKISLPANVPEVDRKVARGAVVASRNLFHHLSASSAGDIALATGAHSTLGPYLRAAQSTSRFEGDDKVSERSRWQPVDFEILALLQDHLYWLENAASSGDATTSGDVWTEGSTACDLLRGILPVAMSAAHKTSDTIDSDNPLHNLFETIIHHLPQALGKLYPASNTAPLFFHPKYIDLLLQIPQHLDEEYAGHVIDFYQRECLCLPFTSNWIINIWKLMKAFYIPATTSSTIRKKVVALIFQDVYKYAEDLPEHRIELVDKAIIPFLETALQEDQDEDFIKEVLAVLVNATVAETMERDEQRRGARAKPTEEIDQEDLGTLPGQETDAAASERSFDAARTLIARLATQTACKEVRGRSGNHVHVSSHSSLAGNEAVREGATVERRSSTRSREAPSGLRGIVEALSPPRHTRDLPSISAITSPSGEDTPTMTSPSPNSENPVLTSHTDCRSLYAVNALIAMFFSMAFAPPHSLVSTQISFRTPASSRCITIYRDLLGLLYPMTDDQQKPVVKVPARCPRARLAILQFLVRLRADSKHRIYIKHGLENVIAPYAAVLKRTIETEKAELEETARRSARTSARAVDEDRGRTSRSQADPATRSRSRSKAPVVRGVDPSYNPLWRIPDELTFELPKDSLPSEGLLTYDPNHASLKDPAAPPVEGVWLPVSEYLRVLNGILRGHDWELVSFVLTFLPLQLSNKLFFHGSRATKEVRSLLEVLSVGVLGGGAPWERRFNVPSFIKRADINAAAYQSLSILISYRGVLTRLEQDGLVQAFMAGLQGKEQIAKPCLQALTLAVYELEQSVSRNLTEIMRAMINILTTTGLAVHILEFLIALGQNTNVFRNFTDEQYRLVFRVAIGYITEHNARSDTAVDISDPTTREAYILSQHVIGLAYSAIYLWFLALRLPQRPNLVSEITREILKGRSQRVIIDEMAEVCFDWLARYTYGNADPKPASSFLADVVMSGGEETNKSASWVLGGAIITITSHPRSGWATVTTTRPTGTTAVICKLENVPLVDLGEANADMISLPAVLMANRDPKLIQKGEDASEPSTDGAFDTTSQHGSIWSGATPSQRRKDVIVDPSYLAIQLLSSYPNTSLDTPRGRLIPPEDKFNRALRGIQNTPVIDNVKIAILYVGPGQTTETEILSNIDGSPLYLDFLSGLGRLIRLKGQVDVFVGGLNRDNDSDGEYAYAWWDDLSQMVFHTPTMMPNLPAYPNHENKKRLVGNDYVKIVYNESGKEFAFDTIRTAFNFINIVISPFNTGAGEEDLPRDSFATEWKTPSVTKSTDEGWQDWDREDWFKVTVQRADGIPDFSPIGAHKLVSRRALPVLVRHFSLLATDLAARFVHIRDAQDATAAEYITSWRSRLRAMHRLQAMLPPIEFPDADDVQAREHLVRDFTRLFSYRPPPKKEDEK